MEKEFHNSRKMRAACAAEKIVEKGKRMGEAQISICFVFTVIYFSMLALQQIMDFLIFIICMSLLNRKMNLKLYAVKVGSG